ncbi:chitotriosidase-1-like [Ptiloglossa arizonensis]|uniref:chitotriosidase-1-like n=1 Tax=Ptiloglossa arizonensis TaxID=3350558 RepID=UPI003FA00AF2
MLRVLYKNVPFQMFKAVVLIALVMFTSNGGVAAKKKTHVIHHDTLSFRYLERIVCYFGSWAVYRPGIGAFQPTDIDPRLCTHLIYAFAGLNTDGSIKVLDAWADLPDGGGKAGYNKFNALRQSNPALKTMIAIGGSNQASSTFSQVAANAGVRSQFVQNVVQFLQRYNFDGFDVDWEYPNQLGGQYYDQDNFVSLLRELRQALDQHGYTLSAAVAAAQSSAALSYHIAQVAQYVHFINLMAYDFHGSWNNYVGINAPLYASSGDTGYAAELNVNAAVRYWLSQGAPADKINLGIPSYGRSFTLTNPGNHGLGAPSSGAGTAGPYTRQAGMLGYYEICSDLRQGGWTVVRDQQQRVPYAYEGNQWVGYDDPTSVREKANYINSLGLGGAMLWTIDTDDFRGSCGQKYPLLTALNQALT